MPELSKDPFGDAMTRAFFLRDSPGIHDWNPGEPNFYGQDYGSMMFKPLHHGLENIKPLHHGLENPSKFLGVSTPRLPRTDSVDAFLRPGCHFPLENELKPLNFIEGYLPYAAALNHNYQPPHLEVPEIDESSNWMSDVLHEFPSISTHELSPVTSIGHFSFDLLPPPDQSPSIDLPISLPMALVHATEDASAAPTTPHLTTSVGTISQTRSGVPSPLSKMVNATTDDLVSISPTPKPLKPRVPKRSQRGQEKTKKVANVEQLEHVRRERQRRDDMSFKILTLECLLPPAGPNLKRDRASVVHDSVHYLKSLQKQVEGLQKTFSDMKLNKPTRCAAMVRSDCVKPTNSDIAACKCDSSRAKLVEYHIQVEGESTARLEKCRCRPDYKSRAMKVLEQLHLDICRCTITRMCDYTLCVISAKPRLTSSQVVSSSSVVNALRSSIEIS